MTIEQETWKRINERKQKGELMKIEIQHFDKLTTGQLYEVLKLRGEIFVVEQECVYPDCDGRDRDCWHLMVWDDEKSPAAHGDPAVLAGYLRILPHGSAFDEMAIGRVMVRDSYRGGNLAREMMQHALAFIAEQGEKRVRISAQQYLTGFYGSLGFRIVSEGYLEDGIPHIDMLWDREANINA